MDLNSLTVLAYYHENVYSLFKPTHKTHYHGQHGQHSKLLSKMCLIDFSAALFFPNSDPPLLPALLSLSVYSL